MLSKQLKQSIKEFSLKKFMKTTQQSFDAFCDELSVSEKDVEKAKAFYSKCFRENLKLEDELFNKFCCYWQDKPEDICKKKALFIKLFSQVEDRQALVDLLNIVYEKGQLDENDSNNPDL